LLSRALTAGNRIKGPALIEDSLDHGADCPATRRPLDAWGNLVIAVGKDADPHGQPKAHKEAAQNPRSVVTEIVRNGRHRHHRRDEDELDAPPPTT